MGSLKYVIKLHETFCEQYSTWPTFGSSWGVQILAPCNSSRCSFSSISTGNSPSSKSSISKLLLSLECGFLSVSSALFKLVWGMLMPCSKKRQRKYIFITFQINFNNENLCLCFVDKCTFFAQYQAPTAWLFCNIWWLPQLPQILHV